MLPSRSGLVTSTQQGVPWAYEVNSATGGLFHPERHQNRVDVLVPAPVVILAQPLALEAELLVELDRRLVPGEDVQLELADARVASPRDRLLQQGTADPAA